MQVQLCQKNLDAFYSLWTDPPEILRKVYERQAGDEIILVFASKSLFFKTNPDDTLSVRSRKSASLHTKKFFRISRSVIWQQFIGRPFGWGWVTVNQQGYCDGVLLSFEGITPNVSLEVVASSIKTNRIVPQDEIPKVEIVENGEFSIRHLGELPGEFAAKASSDPVQLNRRDVIGYGQQPVSVPPNYPLLPVRRGTG